MQCPFFVFCSDVAVIISYAKFPNNGSDVASRVNQVIISFTVVV